MLHLGQGCNSEFGLWASCKIAINVYESNLNLHIFDANLLPFTTWATLAVTKRARRSFIHDWFRYTLKTKKPPAGGFLC